MDTTFLGKILFIFENFSSNPTAILPILTMFREENRLADG